MNRERELTYDERRVWDECPICHAPDGESCYSSVGIPLGRNVNGEIAEGGVHLARLRAAPRRVRVIAVTS